MRVLGLFASSVLLLVACSGSSPPDAAAPEGAPPAPGSADAASAPPPAGPASATAAATPPPSAASVAPVASGVPKGGPSDAPLLGKLTDADVQATLAKNYGNFDPCYPESLKKKAADIRVQMKPTIGPGGKVNELLVTKSSGDKKFDACVMDAFKKIQFPASKEGSAFVSPTWIELGGQMVMQK